MGGRPYSPWWGCLLICFWRIIHGEGKTTFQCFLDVDNDLGAQGSPSSANCWLWKSTNLKFFSPCCTQDTLSCHSQQKVNNTERFIKVGLKLGYVLFVLWGFSLNISKYKVEASQLKSAENESPYLLGTSYIYTPVLHDDYIFSHSDCSSHF